MEHSWITVRNKTHMKGEEEEDEEKSGDIADKSPR